MVYFLVSNIKNVKQEVAIFYLLLFNITAFNKLLILIFFFQKSNSSKC